MPCDPRVETDPDFILLKRFGYSMQRLIARYPDGAPTHVIAEAMGMTEEEVQEVYANIVETLRLSV